jgi:hypothetical protein
MRGHALAMLDRADGPWEITTGTSSIASVEAAARAGLAVGVLASLLAAPDLPKARGLPVPPYIVARIFAGKTEVSVATSSGSAHRKTAQGAPSWSIAKGAGAIIHAVRDSLRQLRRIRSNNVSDPLDSTFASMQLRRIAHRNPLPRAAIRTDMTETRKRQMGSADERAVLVSARKYFGP